MIPVATIPLAMAGVAEALARRSEATLLGSGLRLFDPFDAADLAQAISDATEILAPFALAPEPLPPAELVGVVYESLQAADARRKGGVHYTPSKVAVRLVDIVIDAWPGFDTSAPSVLDPAMGGGAFLVAAARRLLAIDSDLGFGHLKGRDIDPTAVAVTEAALALFSIELGRDPAEARTADLVAADALVERLPVVDCVVGNPPFQNQLRASTANDDQRRSFLKERFGSASTAYTDSASLFLLAGLDALAPNGRLSLIQPLSLLASRDATATRAWILDHAEFYGLWFSAEPVFEASVRVCAPVIGSRRPAKVKAEAGVEVLQRWNGPDVDEAASFVLDDPIAVDWGYLVADLAGVPPVVLVRSGDSVSSIASTTAGFRDQFYGFVPHAREQAPDDDRSPHLVTVGMIDPLCQRWGTESFRFAKQAWRRPVVDMSSLEATDRSLAAWAHDRLRPKVVVATQTKVVEVVVDADGRWLPVTPGISVEPHDPGDIWKVAALLSAPVISAELHVAGLGTALSVNALKMSANALGALPLPSDHGAWTDGAELAREAMQASAMGESDRWRELLHRLGQVMQRAYGAPGTASTTTATMAAESESAVDAVHQWWLDRLPPWRIPAASEPA